MREETCCRHMGYSFRLTARVLLYAPSHRQDSTYHGLCYTSRGALAGTRNSSMGPPHEGSIRRPIAPWANALTTELHLAPLYHGVEVLVPPWTSTWRWASLAPFELGVARRGHHRWSERWQIVASCGTWCSLAVRDDCLTSHVHQTSRWPSSNL